jgi:hypothetical protein
MSTGPGPGLEALPGFDPRAEETVKMKKWLPILAPIAEDPETPVAVKTLFSYIRGF